MRDLLTVTKEEVLEAYKSKGLHPLAQTFYVKHWDVLDQKGACCALGALCYDPNAERPRGSLSQIVEESNYTTPNGGIFALDFAMGFDAAMLSQSSMVHLYEGLEKTYYSHGYDIGAFIRDSFKEV